MENITTSTVLFGIAIPIIGYFLIMTMNRISKIQDKNEKVEEHVQNNKTEIEILKNNHNNLGAKIDDLSGMIKEISNDIKLITRFNRKNGNNE
jgi:peptidoglycan hydrolase CwlO-like protein